MEIILRSVNAPDVANWIAQILPTTAMNIGCRNIVYLEVIKFFLAYSIYYRSKDRVFD
jgi:hypothetical protein